MEQIPKEIVDYATELGYTKQSIFLKRNGITYYHLSKPRKNDDRNHHKIGFPVLVRIKGGLVEEVPFIEAKEAILAASKEL